MMCHSPYGTEIYLCKTTCSLLHTCDLECWKNWSVLKHLKKQRPKREKEQQTFRVNRYQSKKINKIHTKPTNQPNTTKKNPAKQNKKNPKAFPLHIKLHCCSRTMRLLQLKETVEDDHRITLENEGFQPLWNSRSFNLWLYSCVQFHQGKEISHPDRNNMAVWNVLQWFYHYPVGPSFCDKLFGVWEEEKLLSS